MSIKLNKNSLELHFSVISTGCGRFLARFGQPNLPIFRVTRRLEYVHFSVEKQAFDALQSRITSDLIYSENRSKTEEPLMIRGRVEQKRLKWRYYCLRFVLFSTPDRLSSFQALSQELQATRNCPNHRVKVRG